MFITFFSTDDMNLSKIKDQDTLGISLGHSHRCNCSMCVTDFLTIPPQQIPGTIEIIYPTDYSIVSDLWTRITRSSEELVALLIRCLFFVVGANAGKSSNCKDYCSSICK